MPELPEVDIVKQSLKKSILYKKITRVLVNNRNLRFKIKKGFENTLYNKKVLNVSRKAKYLILHFEKKQFLIIHFGMSGTLHLLKNKKKNKVTNLSFYNSKKIPQKHNHVEIFFSNFKIVYNDPRRFGFFKLVNNTKKLNQFFKKIGPEPKEKKFNFNYLKKKLLNKSKNIKNTLLDQALVSGLGNIYVNEILFYARINPLIESSKINYKQINKIIKYSRYVLKMAIKRGGSSIRNFLNTGGETGNFQNEFKVYGKENEKCSNKNCNEKISKIFISNRSTFYCKTCQK